MSEHDSHGGGLQIGRMGVRIPGESRQAGDALASHLEARLPAEALGPARHLPRVDLRVTVAPGAGPERVAEAIARALERRLA